MKNIFKSLMLVAVAAMGFTACQKEGVEESTNNSVAESTYTMTFTAEAPESRTSVAINGDEAIYSWCDDDVVGFIQNAIGTDVNKCNKSNSKSISIEGTKATFTTNFDNVAGATTFNYGAFYPGASWVNTTDFNNVTVKINPAQTLTAGTFDHEADLMISKPILNVTEKDGHGGVLEFSRIAAIGKMNLKLTDMVEGEIIESVKFTLAEGTHFNGPVTLDMENSTYELGTTDTSNAVTLTGELAANADRTAIFFTCFPGEYSGAYTIDVVTDKASYRKEGTLVNALVFTAGDVLNFNATVGNREAEVIEENTIVDELDRAFTGITGTSYTNWSGKTGASGAVYAGQSAGGNDAIQLRSSGNNSGIVTTTSGGKVTKVVVTWHNNTNTSRVLNIYGKNSAYTAATDLYNTNTQGTLLGTIKMGSTTLEIDGDYEYIGLHSTDGAMYLNKIEITWAADSRTAQTLSFPEASYTITEGDEFTAPTVTGAETAVTYTSSDEDVATVNASTGAVTIEGTGTTTITATAAADATYKVGTASYTLTVNAQSTGGGEVETKTVTCEFTASTMQEECQNYTSTWTNISDGITFTVANANNNNKGWSYIRVGAKQSTDNISYVSTTTAFDFAVETVTVSCEKLRGSGTITVYVASNADFTSDVQTVSAAVATGDIALTIPTPATNMFYKVEFMCTNTSKSNGVANISSIVFNN